MSGPNDRTRRQSRRTTASRLTEAALVVVVVLAPLLAAARATAQVTATDPRLQLVSQTAWVAPNGALVLRVRPLGDEPIATIRTQVYGEVDGRIRFERSLRGEGLGTALRPGPDPIATTDAPPTPDGTLEITVPVSRSGPAPAGGVVLPGPGVYPVVVTALAADGREISRLITHLIRLPTADTVGPSLAVGTVVPYDVPVTPDADGTPIVAPESRRALAATTSALAAWPTVALTVDPVPAVLAALEADPASSPTVASLGNHLAGRQVLAAPYVALDTGAWIASGLEPELDEQLSAGATTAGTILGIAPDGRTGLADPTLTPEALSRLHDLGLDRLVIPSDQLVPIPDAEQTTTLTELFDVTDSEGDAIQAVAADVALADRLEATDDPVLNAHQALADLAILYNDQPAVSRGVALDVGDAVDPITLGVLLAAFTERAPPGGDGRPIVSPVTIDDLFRTVETATTETRGRSTTLVRTYLSAPAGNLGSYPEDLRATTDRVAGYRSLTEPTPGLADGLERSLLLSGAADLDAAGRTAILDAIDAQIDDAAAEVVAPLQQYVTLTSRSGEIPLNLENRLPYPVRVRVVLRSAKLEFPDGDSIDTVLPAATTTRLDVAVTTRASGAFPLEVSVRSPDDVLELTTTSFTVRSTAVSGIGLAISIGAGLFLATWWLRHFRKTRRARQLVESTHPAVTSAARATVSDAAQGYAPTRTE
jgi:hypothetical protein